MKILYCCGNQNDPLANSLAKKHNVTICTPDVTGENIAKILSKIPRTDFFFVLEQQPLFIPQNLEKIKIPKVVYLVDLHVHFDTWHKHFAKLFDIVFCAQKKYAEKFIKLGFRNVFWLPLYSDPRVDKNLGLKRIFDFGFVGTLNPRQNFKRSLILYLLKRKFNLKIGQNTSPQKRGKIYNQSKLAINISIAGDLNFRTFESMASGSMLLTDSQDGLTTFFKNKKHLVVYKNIHHAFKLGGFYLKNKKQRHKIALNGQKEVLAKHTSDQRAEEITKLLGNLKNIPIKKNGNSSYIMAKTYFFNGRKKETIAQSEIFLKSNKDFKNKVEVYLFLLIIKFFPRYFFAISTLLLRRTYKFYSSIVR